MSTVCMVCHYEREMPHTLVSVPVGLQDRRDVAVYAVQAYKETVAALCQDVTCAVLLRRRAAVKPHGAHNTHLFALSQWAQCEPGYAYVTDGVSAGWSVTCATAAMSDTCEGKTNSTLTRRLRAHVQCLVHGHHILARNIACFTLALLAP